MYPRVPYIIDFHNFDLFQYRLGFSINFYKNFCQVCCKMKLRTKFNQAFLIMFMHIYLNWTKRKKNQGHGHIVLESLPKDIFEI